MMEIWLVTDYCDEVEVMKRHLFSVDRKFQNKYCKSSNM